MPYISKEQIEILRNLVQAGSGMANVLFNVTQRKDPIMWAGHDRTPNMIVAYKDWDAQLDKAKAMMSAWRKR